MLIDFMQNSSSHQRLKSGEIVQNKFLSLAIAKVKIFFCARLPLF